MYESYESDSLEGSEVDILVVLKEEALFPSLCHSGYFLDLDHGSRENLP